MTPFLGHTFSDLFNHQRIQSVYNPGDAGVMNYGIELSGTDGTNNTNDNIGLTNAQVDIIRGILTPDEN